MKYRNIKYIAILILGGSLGFFCYTYFYPHVSINRIDEMYSIYKYNEVPFHIRAPHDSAFTIRSRFYDGGKDPTSRIKFEGGVVRYAMSPHRRKKIDTLLASTPAVDGVQTLTREESDRVYISHYYKIDYLGHVAFLELWQYMSDETLSELSGIGFNIFPTGGDVMHDVYLDDTIIAEQIGPIVIPDRETFERIESILSLYIVDIDL